MARRHRRRTRTSVKQRQRYKLLIATGVGCIALTVAVMTWLQVSNPDESRAAVVMELRQDALPTDMKVEKLIAAPKDTLEKTIRTKHVQPLSKTPSLSFE